MSTCDDRRHIECTCTEALDPRCPTHVLMGAVSTEALIEMLGLSE